MQKYKTFKTLAGKIKPDEVLQLRPVKTYLKANFPCKLFLDIRHFKTIPFFPIFCLKQESK